MNRPMRWPAAIAAVILLLAACTGAPATTSPPADGGEAPATEPATGGEGMTVSVDNLSFGGDITVPAGTTVTFVNEDSVPHTVTHGTDGSAADGAAFDESLPVGESVEITFDESGSFPVTCTLHPTMNITVTVEG